MPGWFANQVAIITGASSGIGWCLAQVLVGEGARLGLIARRQDKLVELVQEIRRAGGSAEYVVADVGNREQTFAAIHDLGDKLGPIDLLIANAGVGRPTYLDPPNVGDVEMMFRVNVLGTIYAIDAVLPQMLQRGRGHLAAISSIAALKGLPGESGYCSSKAAVNTYMEGLRIHLRKKGIAVSTICPGFVKTPMTEEFAFDMPWVLEAEAAARKIARALHNKRKVYAFPWQMRVLMALARWAPDWALYKLLHKYEDKVPRPDVSQETNLNAPVG